MFENFFEELSMYDTQDPMISLLSVYLNEPKAQGPHKYANIHGGFIQDHPQLEILLLWGL